jgi:Kelch motif
MLAACSWNRRDVLAVIAGLGSLAACAAAGQPAGRWSRGAPMPSARSELTSAVLDGRIYVAGGIAQLGASTDFAVYDPQADVWAELPPLPEDLHHLGAAAAGGRIYLTGGYADIAFGEKSPRTWVYDPGARQWTQAADMPAPRAAHAMAAIGDRLYVVGGVGQRSEELCGSTTPRPTAGIPPRHRCQPHASISPGGDRRQALRGRGPRPRRRQPRHARDLRPRDRHLG